MPVYQGDGPPRVDEDFSKLPAEEEREVLATPSDDKPTKGFDINDLIFKGTQESPKR